MLALAAAAHAARNQAGDAVPKSGLELLVFEVEHCRYCDVLKRDVLPRYRAAPLGSQAPMRFIDLNRIDTRTLSLREEVRMVPTTVLMKDGREVERIDGYTGPDLFLTLVARMIERAR
jgi:thioredoxin-related protein